jgi:hypothetical protein
MRIITVVKSLLVVACCGFMFVAGAGAKNQTLTTTGEQPLAGRGGGPIKASVVGGPVKGGNTVTTNSKSGGGADGGGTIHIGS